MARIDYFAIEEVIKTQLTGDSTLVGVSVHVEDELTMARGKHVFISLERRDAPDEQAIAAGTQTRFQIRFSLKCFDFGLDRRGALEARDDLLGKVEVALMKDRTFSGAVAMSWLAGGEFESGQGTDGFFAAAEVVLIADARATT